MTTGERIKQARTALGLSQEKFAHSVGVTRATVDRWENGHREPAKSARRKLFKVYGVDFTGDPLPRVVLSEPAEQRRNLGVLCVTYQLLEDALNLKGGQEIVRVYESPDKYGSFKVVVRGPGMPVCLEGCEPAPVSVRGRD